MEFFIRVIYCFIGYLIIVWLSGCSNKFDNDVRIRSSDYTVINRLHSTSKFVRKKDIGGDQNISFQRLNKYPFTNSNRYAYDYITKGSYSFFYYKVQPGDTLFYIAWITGNDYRILAKSNNINVNDVLKVGQILEVGNSGKKLLNQTILKESLKNNELARGVKKTSPNLNVSVLDIRSRDSIHSSVSSNKSYSPNKYSVHSSSVLNGNSQKSFMHKPDVTTVSNKNKIISNASSNVMEKTSSISWSWPAVGKVVNTFSSSEGGNKGIDISGIIGQSIFSARSGKVVYAGNALFGYGNLIIIKHDHDFLSTYAHNDKILVVEQQHVTVGQKIATMGNSGSDVIKLHFEIRYKGQSVDPLYYLPNLSSNKNDVSN